MSVASDKTDSRAWESFQRFRHYGLRNPREFTLLEKWKYGFTSAAARTLIREQAQAGGDQALLQTAMKDVERKLN